ncbi:asparagine synthetase [Linnemannia schmuckeri]|uniref:asparagine synthase (glutamine-hydrolyzing) n=1 Tax=Linnemannia schmuckeri TaxID=64567 RepID=A0A9P5R924_9FUNG|nr:asparagine synthetase [Linnemannia schmuckeri]
MCGIFGVYNLPGDAHAFRQRALFLSKKLRHRGPDWSGCTVAGNHILCHERLAIVGVESGAQPLTNDDETLILSVNGEIYNHKALRKLCPEGTHFKTQSDCEVILHLYKHMGAEVVKYLDGMFSWVLLDTKKNRILAARDPIGITTLYQGWNSKQPGTLYFASELKALNEECDRIIAFPPGHIFDSETGETTRYFQPTWWDGEKIPANPVDYKLIRESLEKAVRKRLMSEVPYGVLLSGGLDSSLIASIAARETQKMIDGTVPLNKDGDDVDERLARFGSDTGGSQIGRALKTNRADEIFGGYLYFHAAPSAADLHTETVSRVKNLHYADCLRANKSTMAWGVEARVPFLDKAFLEVAMNVDPQEKMSFKGKMEKHILRKAFDTSDDPTAQPYLPDSILWRQKEQFSDGVGYSWIDSLKDTALAKISDEEFAKAAERWPQDTPQTKEAYWYREVFEQAFPQDACTESVVRWIPRGDWGCPADPSGRAQKVHDSAYEKTA